MPEKLDAQPRLAARHHVDEVTRGRSADPHTVLRQAQMARVLPPGAIERDITGHDLRHFVFRRRPRAQRHRHATQPAQKTQRRQNKHREEGQAEKRQYRHDDERMQRHRPCVRKARQICARHIAERPVRGEQSRLPGQADESCGASHALTRPHNGRESSHQRCRNTPDRRHAQRRRRAGADQHKNGHNPAAKHHQANNWRIHAAICPARSAWRAEDEAGHWSHRRGAIRRRKP